MKDIAIYDELLKRVYRETVYEDPIFGYPIRASIWDVGRRHGPRACRVLPIRRRGSGKVTKIGRESRKM